MKFTIGFSPCPNDTFIFDALVNRKIDTEGIEVNAVLEDVQTLNEWAIAGKLDITKLSFPAFFQSVTEYVLLNAGSALGKGVGPLLITKAKEQLREQDVNEATIALPGINTTANLLFSYAYPDASKKTFILFSGIEDAVLSGKTKLGVIIHENRFTYQQKGLHKVVDLGEYWEARMNAPIPLGGIAIKRNIDIHIAQKINRLIRKSLDYAFAHYPFITDYVKQHSQEMSEDVMRRHIELYVNDYSLDLGENGKKAIEILYSVFKNNNQGVKTVAINSLFL
ncbi:MAG: 1,4-dihydroxy-6-naphthoate synthase [Bacteroidetes bacterium]|nr:1,4-dihydroxy-6-naphthoate synthase [Bacteroidota bacterium]